MTTVPSYKENDKSHAHICNCSEKELIFSELRLKFLSLKSQRTKICKIRQNLLSMNAKNESISKSLLKIKIDYENYVRSLKRTLYDLDMSTNKQKVLLRNKLDEFYTKRKAFEECYKLAPIKYELEDLINRNRSLEEEWKNKVHLFELTKKQYYELLSLIIETFKKKVCEFCDVVLKQKVNYLRS